MNKTTFLSLLTLLFVSLSVNAGITTYTFTSADWQSKVGETKCDNTTDGWTSNKDGESLSTSYQFGVKVTSGFTGAGATSIQSFSDISCIVVNYATTTKGTGSISVKVGDNDAIDSTFTTANPSNRDMTIMLPSGQSGQVTFVVNCTRNSIYLNSIAIYCSTGGSTPFTIDTYQLVTDIAQLQDSDQVIFGVSAAGCNNIMGYYDESVSKNNIHAITGKYSADRSQVAADDDAIYTLRTAEVNGQHAFYFQDEIRYEEAYLVASGGKTKNTLSVWNKLYDKNTYGNYGYWTISVTEEGAATIMNLGNSLGKYLQYNATGSLFGCYQSPSSQTPVCLYRRVKALGDTTMILAPLTSFGTVCKSGTSTQGSKTITIHANGLTENITASLRHGTPFSLSTTQLDRHGDKLTISYNATEAGVYRDTLLLTSGDVHAEALVLLNVVTPQKIADAVKNDDYTMVYLDTVVVTKKYDRYIFVRDTTGAMLIYDNGDADGKRYGKDLENGHVLAGVVGRFQNYYGVPELIPTAQWQQQAQKVDCNPVPFSLLSTGSVPTHVDSSMVCQYISFEGLSIDDDGIATSPTVQSVRVVDAFSTGLTTNQPTTLDAIVMISHDEIQLWCVHQEISSTDVTTTTAEPTTHPRKILRDGQLLILTNDDTYSVLGTRIKQ